MKKHDLQTVCRKALSALRRSPNREMTRSALLRKLHVDSRTLADVVGLLASAGDIDVQRAKTTGAPKTVYRALIKADRDSRLETIGKFIEAAVKLAMQGGAA